MIGSYSNPSSVNRCSLCNYPRSKTLSTLKSEVSSEATISPSSSIDVSGLNSLSQKSSRLFSVELSSGTAPKKTLGVRRTMSLSQRADSVLLPGSLRIDIFCVLNYRVIGIIE